MFGTSGYGRVFDPPPTPEGYEHGPQSLYSAQMTEVLDAIGEGRPPRPDGEDGRVVVEVVEAAYRAAGG